MLWVESMPMTGSDQSIKTGLGYLVGYSVRETTGAARAVLRLLDGTSTSGELLETISLAEGESASDTYSFPIKVTSGIYVDVVSGAVEGAVRFT